VKDLILPGTIEAYYRAEALAYLHGIMGKPRPPQSRPCGGFRTSARTCAATSEAGNPAVNLRTMQKRRFEETAELFRFLGFYQQREDGALPPLPWPIKRGVGHEGCWINRPGDGR
jgi:hypothetical protein